MIYERWSTVRMDNRKCRCQNRRQVTAAFGKMEPALCSELKKIVEALTIPGKGILDIDKTLIFPKNPFKEPPMEPNSSTSKDCHEIFFTKDQQLKVSEFISGIVLNDETVFKNMDKSRATTIPQHIQQQNILCGVKVDTELATLPTTFNETITHGLDNLQNKCLAYKKNHCHFTRWRCVYKVSDNRPTQLAVIANANTSARFASISQSTRMVPIIQLEVMTNGDYSIYRAQEVYEEILSHLFNALIEHHVYLEGVIVALGMVLAGVKNISHLESHTIASFTLDVLRQTVPPAVPQIMFLNVGQSEKNYFINLNAIVCSDGRKPWKLSFCYGQMSNMNQENDDNSDDSLSLEKSLNWCCDALKCRLNIVDVDKYLKGTLIE